jgi:lambda repressor-like predicted transcriptional regulator
MADPLRTVARERAAVTAAQMRLASAIVAALRSGYSLRDVAPEAGVSYEQVRRIAHKEGLSAKWGWGG